MKRMRCLVVMIVLTLTIGIGGPLAPASASKKAKTQHRTFSNANAVVIPDNSTANPYPSTIDVSGFKKGKVTDVEVTLRGLNHGYADDVDVLLVAPNGRAVILMSDVGGFASAASLTLTLDDQAAAALPDGSPLESGAFRPTNFGVATDLFPGAPAPNGSLPLATFNGGNPNGAWQLFVVDDDAGQVGAFSGGWDLQITAKSKKHKNRGKY